MRTVRTLPIVHENEDAAAAAEVGVAATTTGPVASYLAQHQRRPSGGGVTPTGTPPPAGDTGSSSADETGGGSGSGSEAQDGQPHNRSPSYSGGGNRGSRGSAYYRHQQHQEQQQQQRQNRRSTRYSGPIPAMPAPVAVMGNRHRAPSESSDDAGGGADPKLGDSKQMHDLDGKTPWATASTKRSRLWRILLTLFLLAAVGVGVGVGLKFGLAKRASSKEKNSSSSGSDADGGDGTPASVTDFPAGSFSFTMALTNVSTGCSSSALAFGCFPYVVFDPSSASASTAAAQGASAVIFEWVITGSASASTSSAETTISYSISSSSSNQTSSSASAAAAAASAFATPTFDNIRLNRLDAGLDSERLVFSFTMDLATAVPAAADLVPGQAGASTCHANQTTFAATMWTRKLATFPTQRITAANAVGGNSTTAAPAFSPWPFAVEISEIEAAEPGIPSCLGADGGAIGDFSVDGDGDGTQCGCWYSNTIGTTGK